MRDYKGRSIVVKVREGGFEYEGKIYKSLSVIAREVTGTKWNGSCSSGARRRTVAQMKNGNGRRAPAAAAPKPDNAMRCAIYTRKSTEEGRVVVYKVNRLSRSLLDFARMMELVDRCGTSFVSVTQNFNTADSMGRPMLNILLSFAQFEREIISERTRDKTVRRPQEGKWVGGHPVSAMISTRAAAASL